LATLLSTLAKTVVVAAVWACYNAQRRALFVVRKLWLSMATMAPKKYSEVKPKLVSDSMEPILYKAATGVAMLAAAQLEMLVARCS